MLYGLYYLLSLILANMLILWFGILNIYGLLIPAGSLFIGLTFTFRDLTQKRIGHKVWYFMLSALLITLIFNWQLALVCGVSFIVSEGIDWAIYSYYKKGIIRRILLSNIISIPVDSILFISLAFAFNWQIILGQAIIKFISSLLIIPILLRTEK